MMSAIAGIKGRPYAVHPWVSFCPWRQVVEPKQFDLVRDAVENKGFIGVKLYPVMGFRPFGNAGAPDAALYPPSLRARKDWDIQLDLALGGLYDWCVDKNVPIMAHCSFSQFPSDAAGKRGAPSEWAKVFAQSRWSELRVNLGHLGGFWDLAKSASNGWTHDAVRLIARYANVYADIADDSDVMERTNTELADDKKVLEQLRAFLDEWTGTDPASKFDPRKKLMYGTDWVMLSRAVDVSGYYAGMRDKLATQLRLNTADFFGLNGARFLGLDEPRGKLPGATQRIEDFYISKGLAPEFLKRWQT